MAALGKAPPLRGVPCQTVDREQEGAVNRFAVGSVIAIALQLVPTSPACAQQLGFPVPVLTYQPGSSVKQEQVTGDCDWTLWDANIARNVAGKIVNPDPACTPTLSQTTTKFNVLGHDLGSNFEHNGQTIFLFGDTIGATGQYNPQWTALENPFPYMAGDTFAYSTTLHAEDGLVLDYFVGADPTQASTIQPLYPSGFPAASCAPGGVIATGPDDVPSGGISLNGQIYFSYSSGSDTSANIAHLNNCSILVRFDEASQTFTAGRQISQEYYPLPESVGSVVAPPNGTPAGHFITNAWHGLPPFFGLFPGLNEPSPFGALPWEPGVLIFGEGQHRGKPTGSSVYLSYVPGSSFWSGRDARGNPATRYFAGYKFGHPAWSTQESDSVPVVYDNPYGVPVPTGPPGFADPGTVGEISVAFSPALDLWFMTYDGGRQQGAGTDKALTAGIYFSYSRYPWGPWVKPQLIFNACRDNGYGNFIYYPSSDDSCGSTLSTTGPAGPTIGSQQPPPAGNDPLDTEGGPYAPEMIERFVEVDGQKLKIFYTMSTWNPYAVVLMESDFAISLQ
jgi:Domain of unknown function (DUF4185)